MSSESFAQLIFHGFVHHIVWLAIVCTIAEFERIKIIDQF